MNTFVIDRSTVRIPEWVVDLPSFRRWATEDEVPEDGRVCFLDGEVWVDMSKEQFFTHNQVKGEFNVVIGGLVRAQRSGRYVPDGMLLVNTDANLSSQPDGAFISVPSLRTERVTLIEGVQEGFVELEGTPDMVLEIVSDSSVEKDNAILRELYWKAGIQEYWLVDARGEELRFEILLHAPNEYVATASDTGWNRSEVFDKSFRLTRKSDELGHPEITLEMTAVHS